MQGLVAANGLPTAAKTSAATCFQRSSTLRLVYTVIGILCVDLVHVHKENDAETKATFRRPVLVPTLHKLSSCSRCTLQNVHTDPFQSDEVWTIAWRQ